MSTNPSLNSPELIQELCTMSVRLFNSKWVWRKMADKSGVSAEQMHKELKLVVETAEENYNKHKQWSQNEQKNAGNDVGNSEITSSETIDGEKV